MATRFWTCHWRNRFWRPDVNAEFELVGHAGGNSFTKRGISPGDIVYIVSLAEGQLLLGGKMKVERVLGYEEAVAHFGNNNIYDAKEHLVGVHDSGTPLNLHRRLSPALAKQLLFESKSGPKKPFFTSGTELDNQATRGVRELTRESASLLDRIIEITDRLPRSDEVLTVTGDLLQEAAAPAGGRNTSVKGEVPTGDVVGVPDVEGSLYGTEADIEGTKTETRIFRSKRSRRLRDAAFAKANGVCCVCDTDFSKLLDGRGVRVLQAHHREQLSSSDEPRVNTTADLAVVCANCHMLLHLDPEKALSIDALRRMLRREEGQDMD